MLSIADSARRDAPTSARVGSRNLTAGELAWIAAIPCAVVVVIAIVGLAPWLGRTLFPPPYLRFWRWAYPILPEPTEHAGYLIALMGPVLLTGAVVALTRRGFPSRPLGQLVVRASEVVALGFVVFTVVAQHNLRDQMLYPPRMYFTAATLVVAVLLALALAAGLWREPPQALSRLRETPRRRLACLSVAAIFIITWALTAINTDLSVGTATPEVIENVPYWMGEAIAPLNGAFPLVSFHEQYGQLWPYIAAGAMAVLGTTVGVYTTTAAIATSAVMLAVYATLRRVARNSIAALALFLPFMATSFFREQGTVDNRYGPSNLLSLFPIRYGGPYLLAWLTARQLDRPRRPRAMLLLFLAAGLVSIDNVEFGIPAFAATVAALLWSAQRPFWRNAGRLAAAALGGLVSAVVVVSLWTYAVSGALPHFEFLFEFTRLYAIDGYAMLPMPSVGIHLAIYATFVAAIATASARAVAGAEDRVLTGMLVWAGVFGLGASAYYVGRSHPDVLIDIFSAWALALAFLLVAVVRSVSARSSRLPTAAELAVLLAFGVAACSIAQTPTPWSQITRLRQSTRTPIFAFAAAERFIRRETRHGERVGIIGFFGHRIAHDIGVKDAVPYATFNSMPTEEQWEDVMRLLARKHVVKLFVNQEEVETAEVEFLLRAGWRETTASISSHYVKLIRSVTLSGG